MTYSAWAQREIAMGRGADLLPFGSRVHLRSKVYGAGTHGESQATMWGPVRMFVAGMWFVVTMALI